MSGEVVVAKLVVAKNGRGGGSITMALEGPQLAYTRTDDEAESENTLQRALRLAREIEELLDNAPPTQPPSRSSRDSTRMARAMASSLIDELEVLDRGPRQSRLA